jgi:hypothetical protein
MLYEIECVDQVTKQIMICKKVASFALAREIACQLAAAVGSRVIVRQCKALERYDVWLWRVDDQRWIRLNGRPLKKGEGAEFFLRFNRPDAVPVFWPVGVQLPPQVRNNQAAHTRNNKSS